MLGNPPHRRNPEGMDIICIEEHTIDPEMAAAAEPALQREAPYMSIQLNTDAPWPPGSGHPTTVSMRQAAELAVDLGEGRFKDMDAHGIGMQVVSYTTPAQLTPSESAVSFTQTANDRLAKAIGAHPDRLSGFAVLPWQDPPAAAAEPEPRLGHPVRTRGAAPLRVHSHGRRPRPDPLVRRLPVPHAGRDTPIPREAARRRRGPGKDGAPERREAAPPLSAFSKERCLR
jgi:predicted TIM-barrel fold metal-dependent hydrolase